MSDETLDLLHRGLQILDLKVPDQDKVLERLVVYFHELKKWNRIYNLVAAKSTDVQILENHFLDSLTLYPYFQQEIPLPAFSGDVFGNLLDVGSGAGFPGLVLKVACPDLGVVLMEPRQKRASFLNHIIRTLGLEHVEVLNVRLGEEPVLSGYLKKFSTITSRALTDVVGFLNMAAPFCTPAGRIICMKGPRGREEMDLIQNQTTLNPFRISEIRQLQLPFSKASRFLLVFSLNGQTGDK